MTPPEPQTDLRVRPTVVAEVQALYEAVQRTGNGTMVYLAGGAGSGRSATLRALAEALPQAAGQPLVVHGSFDPAKEPPPTAREELVSFFGEDILTTAASAIHPLAGLIGQLIAAAGQARAVRAAWEANGKPSLDLPIPFRLAVTLAAAKRPVVCLLDSLDMAREPWFTFLMSFGAEVATLPLLVVLALDGGAEPGTPQPGDPSSLGGARWLVARGEAHWLAMPPVSKAELAAWLAPADYPIADKLMEATHGNPSWLTLLWEEWRRRGVVAWKAHGWRRTPWWEFAPGQEEEVIPAINHLLGVWLREAGLTTAAEQGRVRDLLAIAALEGRAFTAEAVAEVLGQTRDEVLDLFHDYLVETEEEPGILRALEWVDLFDAKGVEFTVWRYAFTSDLFWLTLERTGLGKAVARPQKSLELAKVLARLYAAQPHWVARVLARLYRVGGEQEEAARYQRMAEASSSLQARVWVTQLWQREADRLVRPESQPWSDADLWLARWLTGNLLAAGWELRGFLPLRERLVISEYAEALAQGTRQPVQRAEALTRMGGTLRELGQYSSSRARLEQALNLVKSLNHRSGEAGTLHELAQLDIFEGHYEAARPRYERSLSLLQVMGDRHGQAAVLHALARLDVLEGRYQAARPRYEHSLSLLQVMGDRHGQAAVLHALARLDAHEGHYEAARPRYERALALSQESGDRQGEAETLGALARLDFCEGHYEAARPRYERTLTLFQEIGNRRGEAVTLGSLGQLDVEEGYYEAARPRYERAHSLFHEIGDRREDAVILHALAQLDMAEGYYQAVRPRYERALTILQEIGDHQGEAATLGNLTQVALHHLSLPLTALQLALISAGILQGMGDANARTALSLVSDAAAQLGYDPAQVAAVAKEAQAAYAADRGWALVREVLEAMDEKAKGKS